MKTSFESSIAESSEGFTLIELMVTMVVAMVILAGLYSSFFMQSRVQASQATSVDALEDLRLASNIMTGQLRLAVNLCWDSSNGLVYQPLGATTMTGCSGTLDSSWGAFTYDSTNNRVMWKRPGYTASAELLRDLSSTNGFYVTVNSTTPPPAGLNNSINTVTLVSQYQDVQRQNQSLTISFDVLPRNN